MSQANTQSALQTFRSADKKALRLRRGDFTLTNGVSGQRSVVAEYEAPYPLELRSDVPFRLMMGYHEGFDHTGTGTAEATYNLTLSAIDTPNTTSAVVYKDGTQLTEGDSTPDDDEFFVDYDNDQLTVDVDEDVGIHIFYYSDEGLLLEIAKEKPGTTAGISEVMYDDITTDVFVRNQHSESPYMEFRQSAYQPIVPRDWTIAIYQDGDAYGIDWDDSDTVASGDLGVNNLTFTTPIIDIPVKMAPSPIHGLAREVTQDIGSRR